MTDVSGTKPAAGAVDHWCNLFTAEGLRRLYVEPEEFRWVRETWKLGTRLDGYSPEKFGQVMEDAGFSLAAIPTTKVYNYVERRHIWDLSVRDVAPIVDEHPDRFFGMFGVDPLTRMRGVRELEGAVREHNFRAALLHPHGFGLPINAREWFPFYAKCAELDIPVLTLVGHAAEEMPSAPGQPLFLEDVALYFPELRLVGCSGWPWVEEMLAMAWKFPNVYYGTSQYAPRHWTPELVRFAAGRGAGKVMFGSGFPVLTHAEAIRQINELQLPEPARHELLRGAATRVFRLEEQL